MYCKVAICDDAPKDRDLLDALVRRWAQKRGHAVRLAAFASAEQFLFHYAEEKDYDVLLLDVEMGAMDGVALAKRLRAENETVQIVFVTGYDDYIAEGYEVAALHYLMKPVQEEKLFAVLDRAAEKAAQNEKALYFETGGEMVGNYVTLHAKGELTVKMTLGELEKMLDERFYRVGRSALVNLTQIARVTKSEIRLLDGASIHLPRGAWEGVNRAIIRMR